MEAIVAPVTWSDWPDSARGIFQAFRSEAGENIILDKNAFVENVLPAAVLRTLGEDEMDAYRAPFRNPARTAGPPLHQQRAPVVAEPLLERCALAGDRVRVSPFRRRSPPLLGHAVTSPRDRGEVRWRKILWVQVRLCLLRLSSAGCRCRMTRGVTLDAAP